LDFDTLMIKPIEIMYQESLSTREMEILHLIADELTTEEIAEKLYISAHTAKTHRRNILLKLDVRNVAGMIRKAYESNLIQINFPSVSGI